MSSYGRFIGAPRLPSALLVCMGMGTLCYDSGKGAQQKAQLQDELASLRAARGAAVASAQRSFGSAVDEAKKVRKQQVVLSSDTRSVFAPIRFGCLGVPALRERDVL